jgi:hypothetical protein
MLFQYILVRGTVRWVVHTCERYITVHANAFTLHLISEDTRSVSLHVTHLDDMHHQPVTR